MQSKAKTPDEYIKELLPERAAAITKMRNGILKNIPAGFEETMNYGMIGYVVPHKLFPAGYHCKPSDPLPFINIASQKNYISLYHMGLYSNSAITEWFMSEYLKLNIGKPDLGKGCIRFKKLDKIPFELIEQLVRKITPQQWIDYYENSIKK